MPSLCSVAGYPTRLIEAADLYLADYAPLVVLTRHPNRPV